MERGSTVRRRKLGAELRRQRGLAGLTSKETARRVGWHQSKVSRIETGRSRARPDDVRLLLDVYRVRDARLRQVLEGLALDGDRRGWWLSYRDLLPPTYLDFISLEADACAARTLETTVIPGLLQTPDYARAVTRAVLPRDSRGRLDALVDVRIARQAVLGREPALELRAVIDEAALRRQVAGPRTMRAQLKRLTEFAERPNVRIQVLPLRRGAHIGVTGPFVIFGFAREYEQDAVAIDHLTSSVYLERVEEVGAYRSAFDMLLADALTEKDSLTFITGIANGA